MRNARRLVLLAAVLLLPSCGEDPVVDELPLVVTESTVQGTAQVTVDPEGTVVTSSGGRTTRAEVPRSEIAELRSLLDDADLDDLTGRPADPPGYVLLSGDRVVTLPVTDVPERVVPVLDWVREHRSPQP